MKSLPKARRVVLVGNKISPGNPVTKPDGTVVRTLWGELAYQLGGKKAFARIAKDDEKATSPGDVLRELFVEYGPCLVLIDEWVAYARQLHDQSDLPAGGFETQFTFAQALTESAKLAKNCLLVVSLPASDTQGSPHTQADDVEVGGIRGREALDRLRNVVGASSRRGGRRRPRKASRSCDADCSSRSRAMLFKQRDLTARAFADLYHAQAAEFPPECSGADYEKRIQAAYPIHPEIFDRLYTDWSTLVKFQRTRGVLRLMAAVIHSLWEKGDRNPLILPSTIPIDDARVQFELTRYLSDNWVPIIEKDVDGPDSLPLKIDAEQPNLGKLHATRRVARTIYLGSAPTAAAAHRGLEDRRVKLGCVMPGESPAVFGDALRRLAAAATYLYQDGPRAWYATQPTVTKLAEDRAEQLKRDPDKVAKELDARLRADLQQDRRFLAHPPAATFGRGRPRRSRRAPCRAAGGASVQQGERQRRRDGGEGDSRVARQHAAPLSQHAGVPRGRQGAAAGSRRGTAQVSRVVVDRRGEGDPQSRSASGAASRDAEAGRRRRRDRAFAGDLPVAAGAGTDHPAGAGRAGRPCGSPASDALAVRASKKLRSDESLMTASARRSCASTWTTCRSGAAITSR